jgi:capsular exopolysaccharide synthesis family protein
VAGSLSFGAQGESGVVEVTATSASPVLAADMANVYTEQFAKQQQRADHEYFKSALALIRKQLASLTPQQRTGQDGLQLQNRLQSLSLLANLGSDKVQVAQKAFPPASPSSPKTSRNTILGLLLGLVLGLVAVVVLERLDRRIKRPEELEAIYRLPMLGSIPKSVAISRLARGDDAKQKPLSPAEAETFNLIHAHLRCFNVDRELRTVMVTSPALGDGKSTIARHLAEAAARSGSRVLLLDADLRKPTLAQQIGLPQAPGLAAVLIGDVPLAEAIVSVRLKAPGASHAPDARKLDVLAVGTLLPPNPAELLGSRAMDAVLNAARSQYDLVVIDAAPLTAVSDPFPLLRKVDGVIVVGWIGHSRRDAAQQLHRVLAGSGAPLLGVIANGWKSGVPSAYAYQSAEMPLAALRNGASPAEASELVPTGKL